MPAVEEHQRRFGRVPRVVAADAGFYSQANEKKVQEMGVSWVAVPNRNTHSEDGGSCKSGAGSAPLRNGGRDAKDASAC